MKQAFIKRAFLPGTHFWALLPFFRFLSCTCLFSHRPLQLALLPQSGALRLHRDPPCRPFHTLRVGSSSSFGAQGSISAPPIGTGSPANLKTGSPYWFAFSHLTPSDRHFQALNQYVLNTFKEKEERKKKQPDPLKHNFKSTI